MFLEIHTRVKVKLKILWSWSCSLIHTMPTSYWMTGSVCAPPQEATLPNPTHPSLFLVAIKICRPYYHCVPSLFHFIIISWSFYHPFHVRGLNIAAWTLNPNNQMTGSEIRKQLLIAITWTLQLQVNWTSYFLSIFRFFTCFHFPITNVSLG